MLVLSCCDPHMSFGHLYRPFSHTYYIYMHRGTESPRANVSLWDCSNFFFVGVEAARKMPFLKSRRPASVAALDTDMDLGES